MKTKEEMSPEEIEREKLAQKNLDIIRSFKTVFGGADGRVVLQQLMKDCGVLQTNRSMHPESVMFSEGRRSVVMDILGVISKDEEEIFKRLTSINTDHYEEDDL